MLPVTVVDHLLLHGDLRTIEDGRLVHIIPDMHVLARAIKLVEPELLLPPLTSLRLVEVHPGGLTGPAPSLIVLTRRFLDKKRLVLGLLTRTVVIRAFDMGINDYDKL